MRKVFLAIGIVLLASLSAVIGQDRGRAKRPLFSAGMTEAQAVAILNGQATNWWTTHNLTPTDGATVTTWAPYKGSSTFTAVNSDKPKWCAVDVGGEPGNRCTSPNGKPSIYFYDGFNRKMTTTVTTATTKQTWEFVVALDWTPGSGQWFSVSYPTDTSKNIFGYSTISSQKYPWGIAFNGGSGSQNKTNDGRLIGVLTLEWDGNSTINTYWNNQDAQTINMSAAFASGALDFWQLGASVYGAGHAVKIWSVLQTNWGVAPTSGDRAARFEAYKTLFGIYANVDVKAEASSSQGNFLLKPLGTPNQKVFYFNHGAGQDAQQMCLQTPTYAKVAEALVKGGWYVGCSTASFNNWGSQAGIDDVNNWYTWVKANYTTNSKLVAGAHSMGNLINMLLPSKGSVAVKADLKGIINAGNGVYDLAAIYNGLNPSFKGAICTQYGLTCASCSTSNTSTCSDWSTGTAGHRLPDLPATTWNGIAIHVFNSPNDSLISNSVHPASLLAYLAGSTATVTNFVGNCDHGDSNAIFGPTDPCITAPLLMYVPSAWLAKANEMTP